jgi:hypothetical protein
MAKMERIREAVTGPLDLEYLRRMADAGWELVGLEWQRPGEGEPIPSARGEGIPYGSRVAPDFAHLEEEPSEMGALALILELIVQDRSLSNMAETLNRRGFRARDGAAWTAVSVYNLLPRLIEVSPRILSTEAWAERRRRIAAVG